MPYFPGRVPAETVAALAAISREIVTAAQVPVGINVLRRDGEAAVAELDPVQGKSIDFALQAVDVTGRAGETAAQAFPVGRRMARAGDAA